MIDTIETFLRSAASAFAQHADWQHIVGMIAFSIVLGMVVGLLDNGSDS